MLFPKRLGMMVLGLSFCGTVSTASAQFSWNPFANKEADQAVKVEKSTTANTNPFSAFTPSSSSKAAQSNVPPDQPITEATRRLIYEESRNYPVEQRTNVIGQFRTLSDSQARALLQRMQLARLNATGNRAGTATVASNNTRQPSSTNTSSYRTASNSSTRQPSTYNSANDSYLSAMNRQPANRQTTGYTLAETQRPVASQTAQQRQATPGLGNQNPWAEAERRYLQQQQPTTAQSNTIPFNQIGQANVANRNIASQNQYAQQGNPFATGNPNNVPANYASASNPFAQREMQQYAPPQQDVLPEIRPKSSAGEIDYLNSYRPVSNETTQRETVQRAVQTSTQPAANPASRMSTPHELQALIARAENDVVRAMPGPSEAQHQDYITKHVELRLLYLLSGQRDRALTAIPAIDPAEQQFWTRVFWGLVSYLDSERYQDQTVRTTNTIDQLRGAIQSLQGQANLSVRQAAFCKDIASFGDYTKFERDEFHPGDEILIYSELDNFKSERTPEGQFRTVLKSSIKIFPHGSQQPIDEVQYNPTEDLCRSFRQDFMQGFKYPLPQRLNPGAYEMVLTVEDQLSGKSANYSLNFLVR